MDHLFPIMVWYLALILYEFPILTFTARQHNRPGFWIHKIWGWRKGSAVTDTCGSSAGQQFASQSSCWMVHSHFHFHLEGIWWPLLDSRHLHSHMHVHIHIHTWPIRSKMNLQIYMQYIEGVSSYICSLNILFLHCIFLLLTQSFLHTLWLVDYLRCINLYFEIISVLITKSYMVYCRCILPTRLCSPFKEKQGFLSKGSPFLSR